MSSHPTPNLDIPPAASWLCYKPLSPNRRSQYQPWLETPAIEHRQEDVEVPANTTVWGLGQGFPELPRACGGVLSVDLPCACVCVRCRDVRVRLGIANWRVQLTRRWGLSSGDEGSAYVGVIHLQMGLGTWLLGSLVGIRGIGCCPHHRGWCSRVLE